MNSAVLAFCAIAVLSTPAVSAEKIVLKQVPVVSLSEIYQGAENAIVYSDAVVVTRNEVAEMTFRTRIDVIQVNELNERAGFETFDSAVLSGDVNVAGIGDMAYCPSADFVYELANELGTVYSGFCAFPVGDLAGRITVR